MTENKLIFDNDGYITIILALVIGTFTLPIIFAEWPKSDVIAMNTCD